MDDMEQDYEAIRQENIRKNAELMLSLGLNPVSICVFYRPIIAQHDVSDSLFETCFPCSDHDTPSTPISGEETFYV